MKYQILFTVLITSVSLIFTCNDMGIDSWQWWVASISTGFAYLLGVLRFNSYEEDD